MLLARDARKIARSKSRVMVRYYYDANYYLGMRFVFPTNSASILMY